ncbi:MAG: patatin-like phospholipase family protein [Myxococcales bacterium]|nr:patatin-like phospholipase family protein [Myxococcota bacterium]MDW8284297.1 patatin-like phospholipase family protein [Myxococcales bacterium]
MSGGRDSGTWSAVPARACGPARGRLALVLAGGAARGAYEVGVVHHLLAEVSRSLGRNVPLDIVCGTSVGAIHACALAALADEPVRRAEHLIQHWTRLRVQDVLQPDGREVLGMLRALLGRGPPAGRGGIFHPAGLERLLHAAIPWPRIEENLRAGRLHALTVTATHVATGRTVVFIDAADGAIGRWRHDPTVTARPARIRVRHALASAAIPLLFPAVRIEGELYCDGGLRQNVPLSPARRLGATGLIVVNPNALPEHDPPSASNRWTEQAFLDPLFLLGKALNALLLDRLDNDLDRLERINRILEAGCRRYGPSFLAALNEEMGGSGHDLRILRAVLIRASQDLGRLSAEYVRSPCFGGRASGVLGRLMHRLADEQGANADFLSYLLFDGQFAAQLIELGRADARAHHEELCQIIDEVCPPA